MFDRLGVSDAVLEKADLPPAVLMLDAFTGDEIARMPTGASFRARFKHPYIIIHRIDLHNVLLDACRARCRRSSWCPTPWSPASRTRRRVRCDDRGRPHSKARR